MVGIAIGGGLATGNATSSLELKRQQITAIQRALHQSMQTMNLINWEVGEFANFTVSSPFGAGQMKKYVDREEGDAIWVNSEISLMGQNQKVEIKISRVTGEILEYIENGQKKEPPNNEGMEIIEQAEEQVTVPAGTFDTIRIKIRTSDDNIVETWVNPSQVAMEGTVKTKIQAFFVLTMELKEFGKL